MAQLGTESCMAKRYSFTISVWRANPCFRVTIFIHPALETAS